MEIDTECCAMLCNHVLLKARLMLIQIHPKERKWKRRPPLQSQEKGKHGIAVLATRKSDHDCVVGLNELEVDARTSDFFQQPFLSKAHGKELRSSRTPMILAAEGPVPGPMGHS